MIESFLQLLLLLLASAFFSGSETALFALSDVELRRMREGARTERLAAGLVDRPERTLVTLLLSNMVVNVLLSVVATSIALREFGGRGVAVAIPVTTVLLLLFGEIVPKSLGLRRAASIARIAAIPLVVMGRLLGPVGASLEAFATRVAGPRVDPALDRDELITLVRMARAEGDLTAFEARALAHVLPFEETPIERCMTPRVEMVTVAADTPLERTLEIFEISGRSRLPVTGEGLEDVVGVLLLKDVLTDDRPLEGRVAGDLARPVRFEPETLGAGELFRRFQSDRRHLAIVVGEHGGVEGLVTLEDLLEELVGDVRDESDEKPAELEPDRWGGFRGDASLELDEVAAALGIDEIGAEEEAITLSGLLQEKLGRVARPGDEIVWRGWRIRVLSSTPSRIGQVRLVRDEETA